MNCRQLLCLRDPRCSRVRSGEGSCDNMQSSKDNALREGHNRRRGTRRGKELANEKRKHCTRSGLTLIFVGMMVCVRVCMYEWCSTSVCESERNRTSGSACEQ
ncbi:hypothetical protein PV325_011284, partial [Microctonus aethiopoides]